jgi:hypothetical protein
MCAAGCRAACLLQLDDALLSCALCLTRNMRCCFYHCLQVAALHACCNFINALDDAREREAFQPMLVPMLAALGRCLTAGDESSAQVGLVIEPGTGHVVYFVCLLDMRPAAAGAHAGCFRQMLDCWQ